MNLLEQLQNAGIPYTENEPMSRRTTFGIGGPALLLRPRTRAQLQTAVSLCRAAGTEPFLLGRGSNLLVSDSGIAAPLSSWMATLPPSPGRAIPCAAGLGPLSSPSAGPPRKTAFPAWNGALASPALWAGEYT